MINDKALLGFIQEIEGCDVENKLICARRKEIYADVKEAGLNPQAIKNLVARRRDPEKINARDALTDEYALAVERLEAKNNAPRTTPRATQATISEVTSTRVRASKSDQQITEPVGSHGERATDSPPTAPSDARSLIAEPVASATDDGEPAIDQVCTAASGQIEATGDLALHAGSAAMEHGSFSHSVAASISDEFNCIPTMFARDADGSFKGAAH